MAASQQPVVDGTAHGLPRVTVISSVRLLRDAIASALISRGIPDVTTAASLAEPDALARVAADVVIVDIRPPGIFDEMRTTVAGAVPTLVIAFGVDDTEECVLACAAAGASGYLAAECDGDTLRAAVDSVRRGELLCSPRVAALLFRRHGAPAASRDGASPPLDHDRLTLREQDVLTLIERGMSNKEIGSALHISVATVKHHVHRILEKLHVRRRWAAAAHARDGAYEARRRRPM